MGKGLGFLIIILIWGGLAYFILYQSPAISGFFGDNLLASSFSDFFKNLNRRQEVFGLIDERGDFQKAAVHFNRKIEIFDIKTSPVDSELIFAGSNYGLFVSRDGGLNWYAFSDIERQITPYSKIYRILFDRSGSGFISVFQNNKGAVYKSQDKFLSLEKILELDNEAVYDFDIVDSEIYLALSDGRLMLYSLKTKEFQLLATSDSPITNLKVLGAYYPRLIYLTLKSGGLYLSEDNGRSFKRIESLDNYQGVNKIKMFSVISSNPNLIYVATDYGILWSSDRGRNWAIFKSLPSEEKKVSALAFKYNPGEIYVGSGGKIYKSQDHGLSWKIFNLLSGNRDISVIYINSGKIIIGTKDK